MIAQLMLQDAALFTGTIFRKYPLLARADGGNGDALVSGTEGYVEGSVPSFNSKHPTKGCF